MDLSQLMSVIATTIYLALGAVAIWGAFCVILLWRSIEKKRFRSIENEDLFFSKLKEQLVEERYEDSLNLCNSPIYWSRAVPRLAALAIENRQSSLNRIQRMIIERFERDVLSDFEYRLSWIQTVIKSSPMLGLLGTVVGMIGAFAKLAGGDNVESQTLAGDISFALFTTAIGLVIAIPLVLCGAYVNVRIRKLENAVEDGLVRFWEVFRETVHSSGDQK